MSRLQDDINTFKEKFATNVSDDVKEIILENTKKLKELNLKDKALKVGEQVDSFTILNANNKAINLDEMLKKNSYAVLSFYRGAWCPYCNMQLRQLQKILPSLKILHAKLLTLSPQTPDNSLSQIEKENLEFEVLCDKNNTLARKFGIVFTLDETLKPIYESFGIDILQSNKNGTFDLPLPATFVINSNHEVIFTFVDEDYTNRCEPEDILHAIKEDLKNSH